MGSIVGAIEGLLEATEKLEKRIEHLESMQYGWHSRNANDCTQCMVQQSIANLHRQTESAHAVQG